MNPHSSSTSSSEAGGDGRGPAVDASNSPRRDGLREALAVAAWMILFLVAGDVAINVLFPLPDDPRVEPKGSRQYFNYGWSIEAKIRRAIGPSDETSAPLMLAGWVDRVVETARPVPKDVPPAQVVSIYGMSFTQHIGEAMGALDPSLHVRTFGGPGSPPNHSYAVYERDRGRGARVVILGVLASCVQGAVTNNGMTWRYEGPSPFTYPRYLPLDSGVTAQWPVVRTLEDLRDRLADPVAWEEFVAQLRATDDFYNGFLFRSNIGDRSAIVRMIRRAMAQSWQASRIAKIHGPDGFNPRSPAIPSLIGMVASFAATARADGKIPIVVLVDDRGYRDHLGRILEPILVGDAIPYLSTFSICPASDPRNLLPDGHYTRDANKKIAKVLLDLIRRELASRSAPAG